MDSITLTLGIKLISVLGVVLAMLYGLNRVYARLKAKNQGFGPNSIRAIGIVTFLPILFMLALLTDFQTETLAALLGTVAGYVLSNSKSED
jgi:xanthine/uracil permease